MNKDLVWIYFVQVRFFVNQILVFVEFFFTLILIYSFLKTVTHFLISLVIVFYFVYDLVDGLTESFLNGIKLMQMSSFFKYMGVLSQFLQ